MLQAAPPLRLERTHLKRLRDSVPGSHDYTVSPNFALLSPMTDLYVTFARYCISSIFRNKLLISI